MNRLEEITERATHHQAVVAGHQHLVWKDQSGRKLIELFRIAGMAHGTPLDVESGYGHSGPYMLEVGISSTEVIARGWGLTPSFARRDKPQMEKVIERPATSSTSDGIRETIENALRTAGLMK